VPRRACVLLGHVGRFTPEQPLRSRYVRESEEDPERRGWWGVSAGMALGARVLAEDVCIASWCICAAKPRWRPKPTGEAVALDPAEEAAHKSTLRRGRHLSLALAAEGDGDPESDAWRGVSIRMALATCVLMMEEPQNRPLLWWWRRIQPGRDRETET
jgi:hypothetical protein